jgi:hypothetical protein
LQIGFELLTAVAMKSIILWDVTPCSLVEVYMHLRGIYCFHLQCRAVSLANIQQEGCNTALSMQNFYVLGLAGATPSPVARCPGAIFLDPQAQYRADGLTLLTFILEVLCSYPSSDIGYSD